MKLSLYIAALLTSMGWASLSTAQTTKLSVIDDGVNIRKEPSTDAQVEAQINSGKECTVHKKSDFFETVGTKTDFWYEVGVDGKRGWVFGAQTSLRLSTNPQTNVLVYKRAERNASLHIFFESTKLEEKGWKGHGTRLWDFGYGDAHNDYQSGALYKKGNKTGDVSIPGIKEKAFTVEWKVMPQADPKDRLSTDKEVPVIVSIKKLKVTKEKAAKPTKEEKTPAPNKSF